MSKLVLGAVQVVNEGVRSMGGRRKGWNAEEGGMSEDGRKERMSEPGVRLADIVITVAKHRDLIS